MSRKFTFLSLHDPRGDLDFVASAVELAQRRDVGANAVFLLGNFCGPLLGPTDREELHGARALLSQELETKRAAYREIAIETPWDLAAHVLANPDRYRRASEINAARTILTFLGYRDRTKVQDPGIAGTRAIGRYRRGVQVFSGAAVPCYLMADTILAEMHVPERFWLHFSWMTFSGFTVACLGADPADPDAIPEYATGPRRRGQLMRMEDYPLNRADVILTLEPSPLLQETLAKSSRQLVILGGDGTLEKDPQEHVLSSQAPGTAYVYFLRGGGVERRAYKHENGKFLDPKIEVPVQPKTGSAILRMDQRRAELETKLRLAGVASDLVGLLTLIRKHDPALAERLENTRNRAEAIFEYIRHLEGQVLQLTHGLSAERAGLERILERLKPHLSEEARSRVAAAMAKRPDGAGDVEAVDAANVEIADALGDGLTRPPV
jgi:hypothetical protein